MPRLATMSFPALRPVQLHLEREKNVKCFACCTQLHVCKNQNIHAYLSNVCSFCNVTLLCCLHLEMVVLLDGTIEVFLLSSSASGGCLELLEFCERFLNCKCLCLSLVFAVPIGERTLQIKQPVLHSPRPHETTCHTCQMMFGWFGWFSRFRHLFQRVKASALRLSGQEHNAQDALNDSAHELDFAHRS